LQPPAEGTATEPTSRPTATSGSAGANGSAYGGEESQAKAKANGEDCPEAFEAFWQAYPLRGGRKRGKRTCLGIWRQVIRAGERPLLVEAARHYADSAESQRGFARDPERFLRNEWWRDWVPKLPLAPPTKAPAADVPHRIAKATFV
jgi:hypothetical protein